MSSKFQIIIDPDGNMTIGSKDGTFNDGKETIEQIVKVLESFGFTVSLGDFEQHAHSPSHLHVVYTEKN